MKSEFWIFLSEYWILPSGFWILIFMITINVTARTARGHQTKALRRAGNIPGVIYGRKTVTRCVAVPMNAFRRVWGKIGESTLVDLVIAEEAPVKALVQDVALDPVTDEPIHIDFHAVAMDEEIHARIPLEFVGIPPAVKEFAGVLVKQHDHLEVRALPDRLVAVLTVNLVSLATLEDAIRVKDIVLPAGITAMIAQDAIIAKVSKVREEIVEEPVAAAAATPAGGTASAEGAPAAAEGAAKPDADKKDAKKKDAKK